MAKLSVITKELNIPIDKEISRSVYMINKSKYKRPVGRFGAICHFSIQSARNSDYEIHIKKKQTKFQFPSLVKNQFMLV